MAALGRGPPDLSGSLYAYGIIDCAVDLCETLVEFNVLNIGLDFGLRETIHTLKPVMKEIEDDIIRRRLVGATVKICPFEPY